MEGALIGPGGVDVRNTILIIAVLTTGLLVPQAAAASGGVEGTVRFVDAYPEPEIVQVTKDIDVCGTKKTDETFIISPETKGLRNAAITLVGGEKRVPPSPSSATIRQKECRYVPHVQVVPPGTEMEILNEDGLLHNVHAFHGTETLFNLAQPKYRKTLKRTLDKLGIVHVTCDVHAWMEAYIVVTDEPFVVLTDEDGRFRFDDVPPGTYKVRLWHEALGEVEKEVVVSEGGMAEVNFEIGE